MGVIAISTEINTYTSSDGCFSMSGSRVSGFYSMPSKHFHDKFEIYYLVSGERYYFIKDKTFRIKKGHLVFINVGELHKTTDTEVPDHERILVYFRKEFVTTSNHSIDSILNVLKQKKYCVLGLSLKEQQYVEKLVNEMNDEAVKAALGFEVCLQGLLMKLLVFIGRCIGSIDEHAYVSRSPKHEKVSEIIGYIDANFKEALTIPMISGRFFISPYYLSRIFKETTGFTLIEYINIARVKEAQKLLAGSDMKVIQVSERSGFGSVAQFNRIFKAVTGCSPLNYRKKPP